MHLGIIQLVYILSLLSFSTCIKGSWECTHNECQSTCHIYGEGHVQTFDKKSYSFDGLCQYSFVEVTASVLPQFFYISYLLFFVYKLWIILLWKCEKKYFKFTFIYTCYTCFSKIIKCNKVMWLWRQSSSIWILALPFRTCVTLGTSLNLSVPQIPYQ